MKLIQKLRMIQQEMKVPKNLFNSFGKYKYRNCESILEAVKPFEEKYNVCLVIEDDVVEVGGKNYIKAIATLHDIDSDDKVTGKAFARESVDKKGMDDSQITGTASSYARKYALNGLFLLDDTKDADTDEYKNQTNEQEEKPKKMASKEQMAEIHTMCEKYRVDFNKLLATNKIAAEKDVTEKQAENFLDGLKKKFEFKE